MKSLAAILIIAMAASCGEVSDPLADGPGNGNNNPPSGDSPTETPGGSEGEAVELELVFDRQIIHANGEDAAVATVYCQGKVVTEGVTFYDADFNEVILTDSKFTTTQVGEYTFWASYEAYVTDNVSVRAVSVPVPSVAADPQPENTDFVRRVLMTQITGTACGYCPKMIEALESVYAKQEYASKAVLAASHQFNGDDPAYAGVELMNQGGAPYVYTDMLVNSMMGAYNTAALTAQYLAGYITECHKMFPPVAGISVNSVLDGNSIVFTVGVKAVKDVNNLRVGAWLLEDGIVATQSNYELGQSGSYEETHDNCVRIVDSKFKSNDYTGYKLGAIKAGEVKEYLFAWNLDENMENPILPWNVITSKGDKKYPNNRKPVLANCKLLVFVYTSDTQSVNNVIVCPIEGETPFEYKN